MSARDVAAEHAHDRRALADRVRKESGAAWSEVDPARISESWARQIPGLYGTIVTGQVAAAREANGYLDEVLDAQGIDPTAEGLLDPSSLAGIASDGRRLESLLAQPGIVAKVALAGGAPIEQAMTAGGYLAELIGHTQIADAGRAADQVATAARPRAGGSTRMLVGKSCARCIILAGRWYRWNAGFNRHPKCDCIGVPSAEAVPPDLQVDPRKAFDSMSAAEQDRTFTKAGAQAIRDGADMNRTVNARRGMHTAGGKLLTREAATRRGVNRQVRLMPEQIFRESGGDRDEALRLLHSHGYITARPMRSPVVRPPAPIRPAPRPAPVSGDAALKAAPAGLSRVPGHRDPVKLTRPQRAALRDYEGSSFVGINGALRRGDLSGRTERTVGHIDAAMGSSRLTGDVQVWRGITNADRLFGGRLDGNLNGFSWREDAYSSTTTDENVARGFWRQGGDAGAVQMRIVVPAGTPAVRVSGNGLGEQAELLLGRGLEFRVVADRGVSPQGVRLIDVEVLRA